MKALSPSASKVFFRLTEGLENPCNGENSSRIIDNTPGFMPVHVERIEEWDYYSIAHYGKQNGDLMRDPEMVFHVDHGNAYPIYWRNDYVGIEQFSAVLKNDLWEVKPKQQADHAKFADSWMQNIKEQQNI